MTNLLPCPFCGEAAMILKTNHGFYASCSDDDCGAEMKGHITAAAAKSSWNIRIPAPSTTPSSGVAA